MCPRNQPRALLQIASVHLTGAICIAVLTGCGTNMPAQKTGNPDEFVINRDDKSPLGNLPSLKKAVSSDAASFCSSMGKKFVEKYSIDKERAAFVWPETTLYFECKTEGLAQAISTQSDRKSDAQRSSGTYDNLLKLDDLRKREIITEAEFEDEKKKLLNAK